MAKIIQTTFVVTINKLVKDDQADLPILDQSQTNLLTQTLSGLVEEVLNDSTLVVEVNSISE